MPERIQRKRTKGWKMPPIKSYAVTVDGFEPVTYHRRTPAQARMAAYQDYCNYDDRCTFKRFLTISRIARVGDYPGLDLWRTRAYRWLRQGSAVLCLGTAILVCGVVAPAMAEHEVRAPRSPPPYSSLPFDPPPIDIGAQLPLGCEIGTANKAFRREPESDGSQTENEGEKCSYRLAVLFEKVSGTGLKQHNRSKDGTFGWLCIGALLVGLVYVLLEWLRVKSNQSKNSDSH